jgi:hypothetical protein
MWAHGFFHDTAGRVLLRVSVGCYAGYRGDETPRRFRLGDHTAKAMEVLDRWLAPDLRYFKVRTLDGIYILRNDVTSGEWEATPVGNISNETEALRRVGALPSSPL